MDLAQKILEFNKSKINELKEINEPLQNNFGIYLFTYRRLNKDGRLLHLTTHEKWVEQSVQKKLLVSNEIVPKLLQAINNSTQNFLWSGNLKDTLYNSLFSFNIWNGITFYEEYEDYIEIIAFASTKDNSEASNFYINNLDLLKHFKGYFKEKANHIINSEEFKKLFINIQDKIPNFNKNETLIKNHLNFFDKTKILRYYFSGNKEHIYLTKREAEVLFFISQGRTNKEIARLLKTNSKCEDTTLHNLSERTVEAYWHTIRSKFDTMERSKIIDIFLSSNIPEQICYKNKIINLQG